MVEIIKSLLDDRSYLFHITSNGINCLLIHDPDTDKSAASMNVSIGSAENPEGLPGLAHYLEHLLFMGTKSFPIENSYSEYLSQNSGYSNAYTSDNDTNYYFEVSSNHLEQALNRFSKFFFEPLFSEDCVERELKAVDSEFKRNLHMDSSRCLQVIRTLCSSRHPFSKFSTGNLVSLRDEPKKHGVDVLGEVKNFFKRFYSAERMYLCILGSDSLEKLKLFADRYFSDIPSFPVKINTYDFHPFENEILGKKIRINTLKNIPYLQLKFAFPGQDIYWKSKPLYYISHLIGHESEGSLLNHLKVLGWATALSSDWTSVYGREFSVLNISIVMTSEGFEKHKDVIVLVFQYINTVRTLGVQEWIFKECQYIHEYEFKYSQKSRVSGYVSDISNRMPDYPPEYFLYGPSVLLEYNPSLISNTIELLNPENFTCVLLGRGIAEESTCLKEKWYGTLYSTEPFDKEFIDHLKHLKPNPAFFLPERNVFIPTSLVVKQATVEQQYPHLVLENEFIRLWYKKDSTFRVPKAHALFLISCPSVNCSPEAEILTLIYIALVKEELNPCTYMAELAGLKFDILLSPESNGIMFTFEGYDDKMFLLIEIVLKSFRSFSYDRKRLNAVKERLHRNIDNWSKEQPYQHAMFFLKHCISDISWTKSELLKALNEFTDDENIAEKFQSFLSKSIHVESLIIGNIEKERAFDFAISFLSNIGSSEPLNNTLVHCKRNLLVPVNSHAVLKLQNFDSSNPNSALHYFIQVGCPKDLKLRNKLLLLSVMMHEPSFDQLRTKEQLGYIVSSGVMYSYSSMGLYIIIQSERDCEFLEKRLECFLESYFSILKSMSKTVFDHFLEATINLVSKKDENLGKEFFRNCSYIKLGHYEFDRTVKSVELLKTLNLEDMIDFYERNILPHVSTCLIIKMMSANGEEGEYKESDDINKLRSTFTLSEEARPSLSEYSRFLEISLSKI